MKKLLLLAILFGIGFSTITFAEENAGTVATASSGTVNTGSVIASGTVNTGSTSGVIITTTGAGLSGNDLINGFLKIRGSWKLINENFGYAKNFFIKGLSGEALSGAKAIINEKNTAIKALNKELKSAINSSGVIDWNSFANRFIEIYTTFKTSAAPYIDPAKLEKFNKYIDAKIATVKQKLEYRKSAITKKEIAHKKKIEKKENEKKEHKSEKSKKYNDKKNNKDRD